MKDSLRRLYYRSVLQRLIRDNDIIVPTQSHSDALTSSKGEVAIKKMGVEACSNPVTYTCAAFQRLGVQQELSEGTILATFDWHQAAQEQIAVIWTLRTLLSNVIESLILLDRCLYVEELGYPVQLISMVDPAISPRNMAIIVTKKDLEGNKDTNGPSFDNELETSSNSQINHS